MVNTVESRQRKNRRYHVSRFSFVGLLLLGGCFDPDHPDHSRYEYLYIDGVFQGSYNSFPSGRARGNWKCYDAKLRVEFNCTMVRGGWDQFKYIYRKRQ
jgi:hypothetical protein